MMTQAPDSITKLRSSSTLEMTDIDIHSDSVVSPDDDKTKCGKFEYNQHKIIKVYIDIYTFY